MKIAALLAALAATLPFAARAVTVTGSDIAGPLVAETIKARCAAAGETVNLAFRGTHDAKLDLRSKKSAVGLVYLKDGETLPEVTSGEWVAIPIAYQPIYVAVHRANKAVEIDLATLAGLYGEPKAGELVTTKYDTWACVPSSGINAAPSVFAPAGRGSLVVSQFKAEVLGGGDFKRTVRFTSNDAAEESLALTSTNCLLLLARPPSTENLHLLAVADGRSGKRKPAFAPTSANLHSGDYPLRLTLFVVWRKEAAAEAKTVVHTLLSQDVATIYSGAGLAPTPENIRNKYDQTLDK